MGEGVICLEQNLSIPFSRKLQECLKYSDFLKIIFNIIPSKQIKKYKIN
jgi:hypothetical protein